MAKAINNNPPITFVEKLTLGDKPSKGGYPYQIKASDLDQNFVYATATFSENSFLVEASFGKNGHESRIIKIDIFENRPEGDGTYVLGCKKGELVWLPTEEC